MHWEGRYETMDAMTDDIRRAVRIELAKKDYSQADLARELGMAPQYLSDIMRGRVGKIPAAWQRILDALDLELVARPRGEG